MRCTGLKFHAGALFVATLLLLGLPDYGAASAFRLNGLGARARGMGGAFVAIADDTTAGFWNPAGLAFAPAPLTQLELKFDRVNATYTPPGAGAQDNMPHTLAIPAFGVIIPLHATRFAALELMGYVPYGEQLDWDKQAAYRYNSTADKISVESVGGATAYKASNRFALGVAAFENAGKVSLQNQVPSAVYAGVAGLPDAAYAATGNDTSPNVHVGALWYAARTVRVGAAYRSPIDLTIQGNAGLTLPSGAVITDQWAMPLKLPQSVSLGAAWQASRKLLVGGQGDWVNWSSIQQQLATFRQGALPNQRMPRDWGDRVQLRLGAEYADHKLPVLRVGYSYDPTPVPASTLDPLLFDVNRHIVSAGFGIPGRLWALDVSYEHYFGQPRTTTTSIQAFPTNGRYAGNVDVLTLSISYRM